MIHNQYLSNIAQRNVKTSAISELSAFGSAVNAAGEVSDIQAAKTYVPRMSPEHASSYKREWAEWINKLA